MPIRPLDVRRKEFKNGFRGYDADQVDDFLDAVADEFERTYTENQRMREEVASLRERLQQFEDLEDSIRAALVHAEQASSDLRRSADREAEELRSSATREAEGLRASATREAEEVRASANRDAEDLRRSAQREAELAVRDAQARSRRMLADSSAHVERVQESYEALQEAKRSFTNDFRGLLKTYMDVMENMEVNSARETEAALHDRLDTEAMAVAHEAAREEREAQETEKSPSRTGTQAPADEGAEDTGRTVSGHAVVASGEPAEPGPAEPQAVGVEDDAASAWEQGTPVADELSAEDDRGVTDDAATQVLEPVGPTRAQQNATEPATEPETTQPETAEPAVTGPLAGEVGTFGTEDMPSTARDRSMDDTASSGFVAAEEVERGEPALAEESGSRDFFDGGEGGPSRGDGDSRISRASRFLRRRGE